MRLVNFFKMAVKRDRTTRKCSVCKRMGHDKKTCPFLVTQKSPSERMVRVKVTPPSQTSPHVICLKEKKPESVWDSVGAFAEKVVVKEKRVALDFAEMVRLANIKNDARSTIQINWRRFAYGMATIFVLIALPFPASSYYKKIKSDGFQVVTKSADAFLALQSSTVAALQSNLPQAELDLNLALESFSLANDVLEKEHKALVYVMSALPIVGREVVGRQNLLLAGHHLALGNTYLIKGIKETSESVSLPMTDKLQILANHLNSAVPEYQEALASLAKVDLKVVPAEFQQSFNDFKTLFTAFVGDMKEVGRLSTIVNDAFGAEEQKRYLLVFQNPAEIRPTGGFMGSFGILDVQKGKILNLDIPGGGTYDLQGQLDVFVKPPLPLQIANARWEFQDANWFPDFQASAKKMAWFYQHGRGASVDGVIAINANVLEKLLAVLGPVESEKFGLTIATGDALEKIQKQVEVDYDKTENKPKQILSELAGTLLGRMNDIGAMDAAKLAVVLNEALSQKDIQLYFVDPKVEYRASEFGWTGELSAVNSVQDYMMLVNANLGGNKTNARIENKIDHQAVVQADGSVIDTVVVKIKNNGVKDELFYGGNYIDYLRLYVPDGAELVEAGGFNFPPENAFRVPEDWYQKDKDLIVEEQEIGIDTKTGTRITKEFGKTAFGNWVIVPPGEEGSVYFVYKLPFNVFASDINNSSYQLLAQKQSGTAYQFTTRVIYPDNWRPMWSANDKFSLAKNGAEYSTTLDSDQAFGLMMEKID